MGVPPAPGAAAWDETLWLTACDGVRLRAALWHGGGRGLALLLPGRTEFLEKAAIPAAALVTRGFSVAALDWRGQGRSDRLAAPPEKGHVADFRDYGRDLAALVAAPEVVDAGPPALVVAHSMGGAIALEALAEGGLPRVPLVLSAPMLAIAMNPVLRAATAAILAGARLLGRCEGWPPFGRPSVPYHRAAAFEGNMLTGDGAVYAWLSDASGADARLGLGMPSLAWIARAEEAMTRIGRMGPLPVPALCLVGSAERVVDRSAVHAGSARLGAECVEIDGGRHELLIEAAPVRTAAWAAIDAFIARQGL